jgi:hypothetical protein
MSKLDGRGTKRLCQSVACNLPFYDLNRGDISCPNCGTIFDKSIVLHPRSAPKDTSWRSGRRSFQNVSAPPATISEPSPQLDEEADATSDDAPIDADADALTLEDDGDEEIGEVIKPPVDDRTDL